VEGTYASAAEIPLTDPALPHRSGSRFPSDRRLDRSFPTMLLTEFERSPVASPADLAANCGEPDFRRSLHSGAT